MSLRQSSVEIVIAFEKQAKLKRQSRQQATGQVSFKRMHYHYRRFPIFPLSSQPRLTLSPPICSVDSFLIKPLLLLHISDMIPHRLLKALRKLEAQFLR